jgi:VanZ family protein
VSGRPDERPTRWRHAAWRALPAVLWAAVIYSFSAQPDLPRVPVSLLDLLVKKGAHLTEYAILAILIYRALAPGVTTLRAGAFAGAWALTVLYAVTDEWHQSFVPGRTAAALDVVIDGSGALLGLAALLASRRLRGTNERRTAGSLPRPRP